MVLKATTRRGVLNWPSSIPMMAASRSAIVRIGFKVGSAIRSKVVKDDVNRLVVALRDDEAVALQLRAASRAIGQNVGREFASWLILVFAACELGRYMNASESRA